VRTLGLSATGIDINEAGISAGTAAAAAAGLSSRARFFRHDGGTRLDFPDHSFTAAVIFDAINHIPDRPALLDQLHRVLRPGGILLYTDPVVITGPVSAEEIAARSSIGHFVFMPPGENEKVIRASGFELLSVEDATANTALISSRWIAARTRWRDQLVARDGQEAVDGAIRFSKAVHELSRSRRLSRFLYLARKP
jgi:SAM-dependent methyltransferase